MRYTRVKMEFVVASSGELADGIAVPAGDPLRLITHGVREIPGVLAVLPGANFTIETVVPDATTARLRPARASDFLPIKAREPGKPDRRKERAGRAASRRTDDKRKDRLR